MLNRITVDLVFCRFADAVELTAFSIVGEAIFVYDEQQLNRIALLSSLTVID
jgi:hypothetical protein